MKQEAMEFDAKTPTDDLPLDELKWRISTAIRDGRIGDDLRPIMLGFLGAFKRPKGPSQKQTGLARELIRDIRRYESWADEQLIDRDETREMDTRRPDEMAMNYAEFR